MFFNTFAVLCLYFDIEMSHPGVCYYNGMLLHPGHHNMATSCQSVHCNDDGSIIVEG